MSLTTGVIGVVGQRAGVQYSSHNDHTNIIMNIIMINIHNTVTHTTMINMMTIIITSSTKTRNPRSPL